MCTPYLCFYGNRTPYFHSYFLTEGSYNEIQPSNHPTILAIGFTARGSARKLGDARDRRVTHFIRSAALLVAAGEGVPLCRLFLGNRSLSNGCSAAEMPFTFDCGTDALGIQRRRRAPSLPPSLPLSCKEEQPAKSDHRLSPDGTAPTQFPIKRQS